MFKYLKQKTFSSISLSFLLSPVNLTQRGTLTNLFRKQRSRMHHRIRNITMICTLHPHLSLYFHVAQIGEVNLNSNIFLHYNRGECTI